MKEVYFFDRCFWCLEEFFSLIPGVINTEVGYANGHTDNPTYYEVGDGMTGYEEVCKVQYNEAIVSLETLVEEFFNRLNSLGVHTPKERLLRENQSKIIYSNKADVVTLFRVKTNASKHYNKVFMTKIEPLNTYYKAEEEHQHYFKRNPQEKVC